MAAEPLRSAMQGASAEDTSLALPSDSKLRTGQQRVLEQVHTVKRGRSRKARSGDVSPGPQPSAVFSEFGSFKFSPTTAKGTFFRSSSSTATGVNNTVNMQKSRSLSTKSMGRRHASSSSQWDQRFNTSIWPQLPTRNGLKPSRSDPTLAVPYVPPPVTGQTSVMRAQGQTIKAQKTVQQSRVSQYSMNSMTNNVQTINSQTRMVRPPSAQSQLENNNSIIKTFKTEQQQSTLDGGVPMSGMTLKEAVEFLSHPEQNFQQCGATFIQHATFKEDYPKQEVLALGGIPPLVALLRSSNASVSQSAAAALRNLVFRDQPNKQEVQRCGGIASTLQLLKETDSTETQRQLTGLLWNLSSSEELKGELIATALPVLTESVVVPFTCWSDSSTNNNIHPDVFYSATGCLRNLSCVQKKERQTMRDSRGFIDSLISYVQSCVAEDKPDDKSVENCACILHNLTYQLETEAPECLARFNPPTEAPSSQKSSTVGCFSPKSNKLQKEKLFDVSKGMQDESVPSGVMWLCHPKAMQLYLSLLSSSQKEATLEACCGALQNLTTKTGPASSAMSQIMVQKMGALPIIVPLLRSSNQTLQKSAMCLAGNLSRTSGQQTSMARQLLPELASILSSGTREMGNCDDTIATACNTTRGLLSADHELSKKIISKELVTSLADLSEDSSFPKARKAASLLLYNLWNEKSLQTSLKKLGLGKSLFVNDITTAAHKSMQVIE